MNHQDNVEVHSLIIGKGEVGSSLEAALNERESGIAIAIDLSEGPDFYLVLKRAVCKTLHICFPYSGEFHDSVKTYARLLSPELIIIHSTVEVGTTEQLDSELTPPVVHSPVRGQHPNLKESLLKFVKYIGTPDQKAFELAKSELSNMQCKWLKDPKETELGKLLSTSYYGVCLAWHREMKKICDQFDVDFENVVTDFTITYNEGYRFFRPNVIRPVLTPPEEKIGGHCVVPNARLLEQSLRDRIEHLSVMFDYPGNTFLREIK